MYFLFLNTIFWAVLAFVIGVAAFTLITGTIAGHGVSLFCITGYAGMIIGFFGGSRIISTEKNELLFNSLRDRRPSRKTNTLYL